MTIYTGRGDEGETDLRDMTRVSKTNPRIEAYGTVDELNSLIGRIRPTGQADVDDYLQSIQNHLFTLQADLANPDPAADDPVVTPGHVDALEDWIDASDEELDPLRSFVLPGGSETGAALYHARAVCRRAERRVVALADHDPVNADGIRYLNRLSDALFTFARLVNARAGIDEESPSYDV
jgi:cob(I)alamin adenosyltransferase